MKKQFTNQARLFANARKAKGLTQLELADQIGVHSQFVSNWERGLCGVPSAQFKATVKFLGISKGEVYSHLLEDAKASLSQFCARLR